MTSQLNVKKIEGLTSGAGNDTVIIRTGNADRVTVTNTAVTMSGNQTVSGNLTVSSNLVVSTIKEGVGGSNTAMTIDSTGRILTPARPVFRATGPSPSNVTNQNYTTATKLTFWDNEIFDVGSNFDSTTNYRFTAPVTGYYQFNCSVQFRDLVGGYAYLYFYKNGSAYTGARAEAETDATIDRWQLNLNDVIQLNATQYVEVYMETSSDTSLDFVVDESNFNGFLIG